MNDLAPDAKPGATRDDVLSFLGDDIPDAPFLVGRRGYYANTMGAPGQNDRGIFDDAIFLVTEYGVQAFNGNTDPSITRPGMAVLAPGRYWYQLGIHNRSKDPKLHPHYEALIQASPVTVDRDGQDEETGWFGINIHRAGVGTSSEGCQTIYRPQWDEFIAAVKAAMAAAGVAKILYVLTARP
jgi:lysozyme